MHTLTLRTSLAAVALLALLGATAALAGEKVQICHGTGSESNEVVIVDVSVSAFDTHLAHGDTLYDAENGCSEGGGSPQ